MLESTIHVYLFYVILSVVKKTPIYCFALGEKDEISREYNWYIPTIVFLLTISRRLSVELLCLYVCCFICFILQILLSHLNPIIDLNNVAAKEYLYK